MDQVQIDVKYVSAAPWVVSDEDAQRLGKRFRVLAEAGKLTPREIVQDARPKDAPLHEFFEWDNSKAAEMWRETQAHNYVKIVCLPPPEESDRPVRAFHPVTIVDAKTEHMTRTFVPLDVASKDPRLMNQILDSAIGWLRGWQQRVRAYRFLSERAQEALDYMHRAIALLQEESEAMENAPEPVLVEA